MYESPIQRIISDIQTQMQKDEEKQLMATITQKIDYEVDRDELIKALQYDRKQYDKGYIDGKRDAQKHGHWIKISPANIYECSVCNKDVMTSDIEAYQFCHRCGSEMDEKIN